MSKVGAQERVSHMLALAAERQDHLSIIIPGTEVLVIGHQFQIYEVLANCCS